MVSKVEKLAREAEPVTKYLLEAEPDELFEQLGSTLEIIKQKPALGASFDVPDEAAEEALGLPEVASNLRAFGRSFFEGVNRDLYGLVCGKERANTSERKKLLKAFDVGPEAVAATLAALLVAHFSMAAAAAALVAALSVKLFFRNAHKAMCEVWSDNMATKPPKRSKPRKRGRAKS